MPGVLIDVAAGLKVLQICLPGNPLPSSPVDAKKKKGEKKKELPFYFWLKAWNFFEHMFQLVELNGSETFTSLLNKPEHFNLTRKVSTNSQGAQGEAGHYGLSSWWLEEEFRWKEDFWIIRAGPQWWNICIWLKLPALTKKQNKTLNGHKLPFLVSNKRL